PCEMSALLALARDAEVALIEDCAQAHGATYRERWVGTFGVAGAFSFCQEKIISTGGEGGMVMCDDRDLGRRIALLRDHGKTPTPPGQGGSAAWRSQADGQRRAPVYRYVHEAVGGNARLTEMQSALGRIGLARLQERVGARRRLAERLQGALEGQSTIVARRPPTHLGPAWYRFYCQVDPAALASGWSRDRVLLALADAGVPAGSGACPTLQRERAFEGHRLPADVHTPGAEQLGERSVALAIHHAMDEAHIGQMCAALQRIGRSAQR
ncbi:MAG: DegT/DnrJ/EryC1/StrS family aminotransferase, partial [Pseudomonadota bacterium]